METNSNLIALQVYETTDELLIVTHMNEASLASDEDLIYYLDSDNERAFFKKIIEQYKEKTQC